MVLRFSCLQTHESFFTRRLYVGLNQSPNAMKVAIFANEQERTGLGMTAYNSLIGIILTWLGYAFKTTDANGWSLYINKKSFCHLLIRLKQNNDKHNYFNADYVDQEYKSKKLPQELAKKVYQLFDESISELSKKNISTISLKMLNKMSV